MVEESSLSASADFSGRTLDRRSFSSAASDIAECESSPLFLEVQRADFCMFSISVCRSFFPSLICFLFMFPLSGLDWSH